MCLTQDDQNLKRPSSRNSALSSEIIEMISASYVRASYVAFLTELP